MNHPLSDVFLASCGSSGPLRVGVRQRAGPAAQTWTFPQPYLVIGRRPESDLVLDHWQVSRRHAYLQLIEGRYYCVDLGSRTGTHGGDATERSGWLEPGRAIHIGPFEVRPDWPDPADRAAGRLPGVTWELPGRAIGQAAWRMDRHLALVGRSPACKIRIVEPDVSKFHCSVVLTAHGAWVVDLLGQSGVFVNDRPVRCARVEDGDTLRVGRHTLRARYDSPPAALPRPAASATPAASTAASPTAAPMAVDGLPAPSGPSASPTFPTPGRGLAEIARRSVDLAEIARRSVDAAEVAAGPVGGVETPASALMRQFGAMQQQMFDQFHQTMMMMFEGFAALHREQSDALREEIDRVRGLSREIEALRAEAARLAEASARPAARPWPASNGYPKLAGPPPGGPGDPARRAIVPAPEPGADIHAQLCLKLATIESERQNRWQKILGMMASRP